MKGMTGNKWSAEPLGDVDLISHILNARGITDEKREAFLNPKIKDTLPEPFFLLGMEAAAKSLMDDVVKGHKIGIFSDYDADGATSAGVLGRWIRDMGNPHHCLVVPDRKEHGYGPHAGLLTTMFETGAESVFILDSGTVATDVLNPMPKDMRKAISVIDHHMPFGDVPDVHTVVNPNRLDQKSGLGHMAACGVTFLLCVAAQREMVKAGHLPQSSMQNLMKLLDYVAIGTVCDVVPLVGVNRALVSFGLKQIDKSNNNPIGALLTAAGKNDYDPKYPEKPLQPVKSSDCGFIIGPRLNAEGRIGKSSAAAEFLLEQDPEKIRVMAKQIDETNVRRKKVQQDATDIALDDADKHAGQYSVIAQTNGHEGVVGIAAARIKETFNRPTIVLTTVEPGVLKGSARSVDGFNIGEAVHKAHEKGLIIKGGGHAAAAGLTLSADKLDEFRAFLDEEARLSPFGQNGITDKYDAILTSADMSEAVLNSLSALQPYGQANPEPRFVMANVKIDKIKIMNNVHIKAIIVSDSGDDAFEAIMWGGVGTPTGDLLQNSVGQHVTLAGGMSINVFGRFRTVQMIIDDVLDPDAPVLSPEGGPA